MIQIVHGPRHEKCTEADSIELGQYDKPSAMCNGTINTDLETELASIDHEIVRTDLQHGELKDINNVSYPTASNLYNVVWSCELESIADRLVQGCAQQAPAYLSTEHAVNFIAALTDGQAMYNEGSPCTCTAHAPASCRNSTLLCEIEDTSTSVPSTPPSSTFVQTTTVTAGANSESETNQIFPYNGAMNDRIPAKATEMHNYRRSQLARGLVAKFNGNYLPSASNMVKLTYNCG